MGVPLFYSWLQKRYPFIKKEGSENLPYIDCLYLDLNGIIYGCVGNESTMIKDFVNAKHFDEIWISIINSIDQIINVVNPRKLIYFTFDGVAPKAKMNQQRNRRFKSGKSKSKFSNELTKCGIQKSEETFINNSITPGTKFMCELNQIMKTYIQKKLQEDSKWKHLKIIYSGSDVPGEGEHKIFDYIRKANVNSNINDLTHCIYGNDADLIMLSLGCHLKNMLILRKKFIFKKPISRIKQGAEEPDWEWVNINVLRDCFELDYEHIKEKMKNIKFDLERIIDDFVFICFFVGNDFLPKVFCLDIRKGYLDKLVDMYKEFLQSAQDYIIVDAKLNFKTFEVFVERLTHWEEEFLKMRVNHSKQIVEKNLSINNELDDPNEDVNEDEQPKNYNEEKKNLEFLEALLSQYKQDKTQAKHFYYSEKLKTKFTIDNIDKLYKMITKYMEGIQFVLTYYFQGCPSWTWFFPYYYSPMISDVYEFIKNANKTDLQLSPFQIAQPFQPFKQLLLVMPNESMDLLPPAFHVLLKDGTSILKSPVDYFPSEFEIDPNDAIYESDYIALLPFVEDEILDTAYTSISIEGLSEEEKLRNAQNDNILFEYDKKAVQKNLVKSLFPNLFADFEVACKYTKFSFEDNPPEIFKGFENCKVIAKEDAMRGKYEFSYPTFKFFPCLQGCLKPIKNPKSHALKTLKINAPSLNLTNKECKDLASRSVFVAKPHQNDYFYFNRGYIVGYINENEIFVENGVTLKYLPPYEYDPTRHKKIFDSLKMEVIMSYDEIGIFFQPGDINVLFFIDVTLSQSEYKDLNGRVQQRRKEYIIPPQMIMLDEKIPIFDRLSSLKYTDEFPINSSGIYLGYPEGLKMGSLCKIKDHNETNKTIKVKLVKEIEASSKINFKEPKDDKEYYSIKLVAETLGYKLSTILNICDSLLITLDKNYSDKFGDKLDLGLNLINRYEWKIVPELIICRNYELIIRENGGNNDYRFFDSIEIAKEAFDLIKEYNRLFPELFQKVETERKKAFFSLELFKESDSSLKILNHFIWLIGQKNAQLSLMPLNSKVLHRNKIFEHLSQSQEKKLEKKPKDSQTFWINCNMFHSESQKIFKIPDYQNQPSYHKIGDRVLNIRSNQWHIPYGLTGIIVGVLDKQIEVVFDSPFIGGTNLGGRCPWMRGSILNFLDVFNLENSREWSKFIIKRPIRKPLRPIYQWDCNVAKYIPKFWNKIVEKMDEKTVSTSKNPLIKIMNRIKEEEKTEEHKIADPNNNQIKKEMTADKKMWNEQIDHSHTQKKLEKKPEVHTIIKKEHLDHKIPSNEKVDNDNSKEEEKHEEHKILEKSEDLKTKTKDLENLIIQVKGDDNHEENKSLEPIDESKKEIIDNKKLTELQENKMVEDIIKKNIMLSNHDPSKDFHPN